MGASFSLKATTAAFFEEFNALAGHLESFAIYVTIAGAAYVYHNWAGDTYAIKLINLLQTFSLMQHVSKPTHTYGVS